MYIFLSFHNYASISATLSYKISITSKEICDFKVTKCGRSSTHKARCVYTKIFFPPKVL